MYIPISSRDSFNISYCPGNQTLCGQYLGVFEELIVERGERINVVFARCGGLIRVDESNGSRECSRLFDKSLHRLGSNPVVPTLTLPDLPVLSGFFPAIKQTLAASSFSSLAISAADHTRSPSSPTGLANTSPSARRPNKTSVSRHSPTSEPRTSSARPFLP
ncbi:hypothetical protein RSOLAG1IB_12515 [Rhizoctonia solani AG-1 IB]|uniref:Uncharacterized protein n=1 Tax=Thanatephorus cucumeris (strain AG1-IB / isolate 7/3/14) TaxID=1108050 RepID=A0A0B7FZA4_THACB|nr:hypothetical protein RSOLAG1IB_12515 [Rhizoctonia solani AG-1 IB]